MPILKREIKQVSVVARGAVLLSPCQAPSCLHHSAGFSFEYLSMQRAPGKASRCIQQGNWRAEYCCGLPAGVGLFLVADDAVLLLRGERWQPVIQVVQTLALAGIFSVLGYSSFYLLLALGRLSVPAFLAWMQLGLMAFLAMMVYPEARAKGIAYSRLGAAAVGSVLLLALVFR